jgi:outer membrane immunogenic protein
MRRSLPVVLLSTALAFPAVAADLPPQSGAPYYNPPPLFTWTGGYVGANASFGFGRYTDGGSSYFGNADGGLFGITAGYNYQSGPLVVGVEGDIDFGSVSGTGYPAGGISATGSLTGEGSIRARFGYAFGPSLVYITGGYTGANLKGSVSDFSAAPNIFVSQSTYLNGFVIGTGLEYEFTRNISVKAEYLFSDYGSSGLFNGTRDNIGSGLLLSTIRAGINYHF